MTELATNVLYYGDNLDILRRNPTDAQLLAFEDTRALGRITFL